MQPIAPFSINCPTQVRFGAGVVGALGSLMPAGVQHVLLIRGAGATAAEPVRAQLQQLGMTTTEISAGGEPSVASINGHLEDLASQDVDLVIACGGGAVIDTGKAVTFCMAHDLRLVDDFSRISADFLAVTCPLPLIVLPTTAGTGAEVTSNAVLDVPSKRAKISLRGRGLFPYAALVDPSLMLSAPDNVVLNAGLDAVTQIIEAYTSNAANAFSDALSAPQLDRSLEALRMSVETRETDAMGHMAWTALASGLALANGGLGLAHGLASVVGGRYGAPHGALCGRFLTPVLRQNILNAETGSEMHHRLASCYKAIARVFPPGLGRDDLSGFDDWINVHRLPRLADFGVRSDDLVSLAEQGLVASSSLKNGVSLKHAIVLQVLRDAF